MLTGRRPFQADTSYSVLNAQLNEAPMPPVQVNPALSQELNNIVLRAMVKVPDGRFQSADEFRNALKNVRAPEMTQFVPQTSPHQQSQRRIRCWSRAAIPLFRYSRVRQRRCPQYDICNRLDNADADPVDATAHAEPGAVCSLRAACPCEEPSRAVDWPGSGGGAACAGGSGYIAAFPL